jgi:hypothetical protein
VTTLRDAYAGMGTVVVAVRADLRGDAATTNRLLAHMPVTVAIHSFITLAEVLLDNLAATAGLDPDVILDRVHAEVIARAGRGGCVTSRDERYHVAHARACQERDYWHGRAVAAVAVLLIKTGEHFELLDAEGTAEAEREARRLAEQLGMMGTRTR